MRMMAAGKPAALGVARERAGWAGVGVGVTLLVVYVATLMPGVPPTDSGELALAAWTGGIAHAPGFPLYTALGWLWSHLLPFGRIVWRLNLLSAVCAAVAAGLVYALALRTLHGADDRRGSVLVAAAAGALALGLGRTAWNWATVAEVYALNLLLTAAILLLVVLSGTVTALLSTALHQNAIAEHPFDSLRAGSERSRGRGSRRSRRVRSDLGLKPHPSTSAGVLRLRCATLRMMPASAQDARWAILRTDGSIIAAAFLFGLGLGNHLTSIALLAPAIAFWLTARRGWRFWISRTALLAALALLAGAAIYLYLPARAAADPLLNWGRPDTWQRFWWQVTAKQYRVSLFSAPVGPQIVFAAKLWWTQFTPVGLALLLVGAWRMARSQRTLFWMLALIILCTTVYAWAYVIEDDGDAYYLPAFLAGAVWVAWGAAAVTAWAMTFFSRQKVVMQNRTRMNADERGFSAAWPAMGVFATGVFATVVIAALIMNWSACDRRADTIPEGYARDTLAEIGANGLLLTRDWQFYAPALYLQEVEGLRSDVTVIDTELLRRDWYFGLLHKTDPGLMASVAAEEGIYRSLRDAWERGDLPEGDPRLGNLQGAYIALLDAFIGRADAIGRPVHVGPNRGAEALRGVTLNGQPDMEAGAGADWQWLPVGLSFRALPAGARVPDIAPLAWQIAAFGKVQPTAPEVKIRATRADMATLHGLVQAQLGDLAGAEADWRMALAVDPAHGPATELLKRLKK